VPNRAAWGALLAMISLLWGGSFTIAAEAPKADAGLAEAEFERRLAAQADDDIRGRLALAAWAIAAQLPERAQRIYRDILQREPDHDEAYSKLVELASKLPLPRDSTTRDSARLALDRRFIEYESKRFVIFSDAQPALAQARLDLLERTHHQVQRFASRLSLRPLPLEHKQVSVLFQRHADYVEFAKTQDGLMHEGISGYYSPRHDWVVFDDARALPEVAAANTQLQSLQENVTALIQQSRLASNAGEAQAAALRKNLSHAQQVLQEQTRRVDELASRGSIATTIHECTHQLLFHTRVQSPFVHSPLWICEGLATNFEADSAQSAFGPDDEYPPRRRRFNELLKSNRLLSVKELVQINDLPSEDTDRIDVIYQESYALVMWMCRFRKTELRNYLMLMLRQPAGDIESARQLELFEQCFGDAASVEKAWIRYENAKSD
jgi:hypothetical protein